MNKQIERMTLDEKIGMVHGDGLFKTKGIDHLAIPSLKMSDGPMGVRNEFKNDAWQPLKNNDDYVTYLPSISALASTWNRELAFRDGEVLGREARGRGKDIILGPGVNIKRTPLGGRNFEYFSEDPFLTIEMATPFIKGVQKNDVAACLKHFALNNQETHRMNLEVIVNNETLETIYLRVFKEIIAKANPYSIMGSYSKIYDEFCCESDFLLNQELRKNWNYDGIVISDWGGVHETKKTAISGVDIEMSVTSNFDNYYLANPLKKAIENGEISEDKLNDKVKRILHLMKRIKAGDESRKGGSYNDPQHRETALNVAEESIILLKNENQILPLKNNHGSILVIGENAIYQHANGGGSAEINALYEIPPLMGIKMQLGGNVTIDYIAGYQSSKKLTEEDAHPDSADLNWQANSLETKAIIDNSILSSEELETTKKLREEAVKKAANYETVIFVGGLNHDFDVENQDRASMKLPYEQDQLIKELLKVKPETVVVIYGGAPVEMINFLPQTKALVFMYYAGMEGGRALAKVLFGEVNPSGRLAETFPIAYSDTPVAKFGEFPGEKSVTYREGSYIGYRYYETFDQRVAFPFGFGLSYTKFSYEDFSFDSESCLLTGSVKNIGDIDGKTVLQVYKERATITKDKSHSEPKKELIQFEKVAINANETRQVSIKLDDKLLRSTNPIKLCVGTAVNNFFYEKNI
ncbi:glycoside hydrolase family 3 protein [Enterococcus sp. JM9B]|uniref:glycoside hydrolase family 3 protein n=1 Tax=Enterococcus sp. JM9B TaxID=1857216 RepID=UPI001374DEB8|nr:glycoside hydrolase family 3 C-terminal domain-containing protein [Enterococcus sp. JM9B]KAF1303134.1 hypothetical protein BAU16_05515 [Enterococcus sp. JM9B]